MKNIYISYWNIVMKGNFLKFKEDKQIKNSLRYILF